VRKSGDINNPKHWRDTQELWSAYPPDIRQWSKAARLNRNCAEHNASAMRVREASSDLNGQPKGV
jgi:hypothetical protein